MTAVPAERDAVLRRVGAAGAGEPKGAGGAVVPEGAAGAGETEGVDGVGGTVPYASLPPGCRPLRVAHTPAGQARTLTLDAVTCGVGPAAAAAATATALTAAACAGAPYDLAVSAGIGGGFAHLDAQVGTVVVADAIVAADLGAQTPDGFAAVTDLGFGAIEHRPPPALADAVARSAAAVRGTVLTVSTVTGTAERAAALVRRHPRAAAEAMEGFGVAEAAAAHGVPVLEVRAVSNAVGPRDRAAWRIGEALDALADAFHALAPVLAPWEGSR